MPSVLISIAKPPWRASADAGSSMLCPSLLPYELGTKAQFSVAGFNGRYLTDDAYDVMLSLATNTEVHDGVGPNRARTRPEFPYYGAPFTKQEQAGLQAIQGNIGYGSDQRGARRSGSWC